MEVKLRKGSHRAQSVKVQLFIEMGIDMIENTEHPCLVLL